MVSKKKMFGIRTMRCHLIFNFKAIQKNYLEIRLNENVFFTLFFSIVGTIFTI